MNDPWTWITAKATPGTDGPNVDSTGNHFTLDPESVVWYTEPEYAGFCGCGDPEIIDEALVDYLGCLDYGDDWDRRPSLEEFHERCGGERAYYFCAYIADTLGWTEHGGSVIGAWLTPEGKQALASLLARLNDDSETP